MFRFKTEFDLLFSGKETLRFPTVCVRKVKRTTPTFPIEAREYSLMRAVFQKNQTETSQMRVQLFESNEPDTVSINIQ